MADISATIALRRLGLGGRPGDLTSIRGDPRGYVLAQLADPRAARLEDPALNPSAELLAEDIALRREIQAKRKMAAADQRPDVVTPPAGMASQPTASDSPPAASADQKLGPLRREAYLADVGARVRRALDTPTPMLERLVWFWSNHFTVSALKNQVRGIAGAFEREAIRPHILGRFRDLLRAVVQHPAMLIYLDNHISIGPSSKAGQARGRGLNENLAREILELHTLGVDGGYTQADVIALARLLTGWSVGDLAGVQGDVGRFTFAPRRHDPGPYALLSKTYPQTGLDAGEATLDDLARQPSTARHIALKLVRHFVTETAPVDLVDRVAKSFRETDGDLAEATRTLITDDQTWAGPQRKMLPPFDFLIALSRATGITPKDEEFVRLTRLLGQPVWAAPSPKGWPDGDDAWTAPSAVRERLRIAEKISRDLPSATDPRTLAAEIVGPALLEQTSRAISRAETRQQGFQLLAMSPDFLRR